AVSVLVANRQAAVLHRALAGRLAEARALLTDPRGVLPADGELLRRFDPDGLAELVAAAGLRAELLQGDGVVADAVADGGDGELAAFELAAAETSPLREIAARLHVLARRR
ncbi:MAG: SAM-dependent methyltransferase, partial [Thermocrispum sp.]